MRTCRIIALSIGFLALALTTGLKADDKDKATLIEAEMVKLRGTWQLVEATTDGKATPKETVEKIRVVIKQNRHSVYFGENVLAHDIPFVIDPTTSPKSTEDTLEDGKKIRGIFKVEGDTLTSCVGKVDAPRPTEFASKAGSGWTLRVFKRKP